MASRSRRQIALFPSPGLPSMGVRPYAGPLESLGDLALALRWIELNGPIPSLSGGNEPGDVEDTLEYMIGRDVGCFDRPGFLCRRLRARSSKPSPRTLFTKEPDYRRDWDWRRLVEEHGKDADGGKELRCELSAKESRYGLVLEEEESRMLLVSEKHGEVGHWSRSDLKPGWDKLDRCIEVFAEKSIEGGRAHFHYREAHLRISRFQPEISDVLGHLQTGALSLALRMSAGEERAKNYGTAFRCGKPLMGILYLSGRLM
jgi:hypothetical protein